VPPSAYLGLSQAVGSESNPSLSGHPGDSYSGIDSESTRVISLTSVFAVLRLPLSTGFSESATRSARQPPVSFILSPFGQAVNRLGLFTLTMVQTWIHFKLAIQLGSTEF